MGGSSNDKGSGTDSIGRVRNYSQRATRRGAGKWKLGGIAQVVALDECDPTTFKAAEGPDFCKNVALERPRHCRICWPRPRPAPRIRDGTSNPTNLTINQW
jgi:hypothetical protein